MHEYTDEPPTVGFIPHGISLRPEINLMVTSDFLDDHLYLIDTQRGAAEAATLDLGSASGARCIALTRDEKRLVISDYFLNEDSMGKVHAEGDHRVRWARSALPWTA